ncbi:unnamed protein product [Linum trigynum]|uniref:Uncharacterized protein n=2 Tax=Linum trigynum TaxID=586398 RepID=A0AAV2FBR3_9ROSI
MDRMVTDILLQVFGIGVTVFMFLYSHGIPQKIYAKLRQRALAADAESKRQFVRGAQLLSQARRSSTSTTRSTLAKQAEEQADKAIAYDPRDAAAHILKGLALDLQGFKTSALASFDIALSPLAIKSLTEVERGDALYRRAELLMSIKSREGRVESAIQDLTRAVEICEDKAKAFRLLGECYEAEEKKEEARNAYEEALKVEPEYPAARAALDRLGE